MDPQLNKRIAAADREIAAKQEAFDGMVAAIAESGRELHELSAEEMAPLTAARKEIEQLKDDRVALSDFAHSMADQHARITVRDRDAAPAADLYGQLFGNVNPSAIIAGGINTPSVEVAGRDELVSRMKSGRQWFATATATLDAGIPLDERLSPPVETRVRRITLLDLITVGQTNTDTVVYAKQNTRTSAAAETALGTAYSEATYDFEQTTASVKSIGHFTTCYRENIADAAQFATIVNNQLQEDVVLRLEAQILAGNGSGSNLSGITATGSGIGSIDHDATNDRRVVSIHRAITTVRTGAYREPTAVVMHPNDYQEMIFEEINLSSTAGQAGAFVPDITGRTPGTVWGLPIVVSTVATENTLVVGYWPDATLWVREGVSLRVSDSHSDYFTKRQVAVLADMRGAFSVQRPSSFCKVFTV